MAPQKNVAIEPELFERISEEAKAEGKTPDEIANEATRRYLALRRLQKLQQYGLSLRGAAVVAETAPTPVTAPATGTFPREAWKFAGYSSPENALISAIYAMQQGYTKEYFNSLTPDEQARMAKAWEGKTPEEIAAKHSSDTAAITGIQVLNQQAISAEEIQMNVHIGGVERNEKLSVKRIGNDWKFNGFIRDLMTVPSGSPVEQIWGLLTRTVGRAVCQETSSSDFSNALNWPLGVPTTYCTGGSLARISSVAADSADATAPRRGENDASRRAGDRGRRP